MTLSPAIRYAPPPSPADQAELVRLRRRFRRHCIFYVVSADRGVRYMAHAAELGVVPDEVCELAALLDEIAARQALDAFVIPANPEQLAQDQT